jgi:hypothetical protein
MKPSFSAHLDKVGELAEKFLLSADGRVWAGEGRGDLVVGSHVLQDRVGVGGVSLPA